MLLVLVFLLFFSSNLISTFQIFNIVKLFLLNLLVWHFEKKEKKERNYFIAMMLQ